jgi:hypothetical protein
MAGEEELHFLAPVIQDNPVGWGPCEVPEQFKDMPYQPFSKGDRLGKVCMIFLTYGLVLYLILIIILIFRYLTGQEQPFKIRNIPVS